MKQAVDVIQARQCAVQRGGFLLEINGSAEQNFVMTALQSTAAGINVSNTTAPDGGGGSYVWTGGKKNNANQWLWDGNNESNGTFFWTGGSQMTGGQALSNAYTNWGTVPGGPPVGAEPDNFQGVQDILALALTSWPNGNAGQWNDLHAQNQLFYVIEFGSTLGTDDTKSGEESAQLYPNAVSDFLAIESKKLISAVTMTDASGKKVKNISGIGRASEKIDCTSLPHGVYFVKIEYLDKTVSQHKIIKSNK
ncbi:hypothetical protein AU378_07310 [Chryseobacterium kwangjuense]|uniref:C-type lectin domain-containing protein n=2 Tax=Chryseobacterium kwangjuense TaxID=267125 RepID=A0A135WKW0_9FLAO|nr:hypothetical protein AU378_07310 [Chryseobacterium kwangjuense]